MAQAHAAIGRQTDDQQISVHGLRQRNKEKLRTVRHPTARPRRSRSPHLLGDQLRGYRSGLSATRLRPLHLEARPVHPRVPVMPSPPPREVKPRRRRPGRWWLILMLGVLAICGGASILPWAFNSPASAPVTEVVTIYTPDATGTPIAKSGLSSKMITSTPSPQPTQRAEAGSGKSVLDTQKAQPAAIAPTRSSVTSPRVVRVPKLVSPRRPTTMNCAEVQGSWEPLLGPVSATTNSNIGRMTSPTSEFLTRADSPVTNGTLVMTWDTNTVAPGVYWLRLIVVDTTGNYWAEMPEFRVSVVH